MPDATSWPIHLRGFGFIVLPFPLAPVPLSHRPSSRIELFCCPRFAMAGTKTRKDSKKAKKEEAKQALVAKLAENFGRSVRIFYAS